MNVIQLWLKLAWKLRTPFILPLDLRYQVATLEQVKAIPMPPMTYTPEIRDCDDFAWVFKGMAAQAQIQAVGMVIGRGLGGLHCWNCAVTADGVFQIEPQTGETFQKKKGYYPGLVII